jgi:hypothetical protein
MFIPIQEAICAHICLEMEHYAIMWNADFGWHIWHMVFACPPCQMILLLCRRSHKKNLHLFSTLDFHNLSHSWFAYEPMNWIRYADLEE